MHWTQSSLDDRGRSRARALLRGWQRFARLSNGRRRAHAPAVHPRRRRRVERPDDGRRTRRRGIRVPHRADGASGRDPPGARDAAAVGGRDHRGDQGEHPEPSRLLGLFARRQPGDPRPARRRASHRQGRHAAAHRVVFSAAAHPGSVGHRRRSPRRRGPLAAPEPARSTCRESQTKARLVRVLQACQATTTNT